VLPVGWGHEWWWELWSDEGLAETESITVWQIRGNLVPTSYLCLSPIFSKKTRKSNYPILDWSLGEEVPLDRIVVPPQPLADPSLPASRSLLGLRFF